MKNKAMKKYFLYLIVFGVIFLSSCQRYYNPGLNVKTIQEDTTQIASEFEVLMRYIPNAGDYINSKGVPNMVDAQDVYDNLSRYLVIDLRKKADYEAGHINGAIHVKTEALLDYLEEHVAASTFDKLILTCYTGQKASYVTSVLRIIGYDNAYALKYGMSSWSKSLDKWSPNISNKYANALETKANYKTKSYDFPKINTGEHCGAEILEARARTLLNTPFEKLLIDADRAFADTSFYIVNYWPEEKYKKGHIPGSVQYTPKADLKMDTYLKTLPTDKKILVYCFTGQNAAFTVAYLRLLGYNAFSLKFGANSFMHSTLTSRSGWHGFVAADKVNDFELVEGANPTSETFELKLNEAKKGLSPKKPPVKRKKKEVEGGCG
jgi:rhodanese-related sulfurtransferase